MDKICNGKSFKVGRCGRMKTLNDHAELTKSHAKKNTKKTSSKLSSQQRALILFLKIMMF